MAEHRIRLYTKTVNDYKLLLKSHEERFWAVVKDFENSLKHQWVEENGVVLQWDEADVYTGFGRHYILYCDVDERLYTDYMLRFFDHYDEAWK